MSNALNKEIQKGEEVIVRAEMMKPEYAPLERRIFVCLGGFGMSSFTTGAKIFGYYKEDGKDISDGIRGEWISISETLEYQSKVKA